MWDITDNTMSGTPAAGPQTDGTVIYPVQAPQPADAGGGGVGVYAQAILDVFKYGVGVWQTNRNQDALLEYKRFEATQAGLAQQGQVAAQYAVAQQGSMSTVLLVAGLGLVALLVLRK